MRALVGVALVTLGCRPTLDPDFTSTLTETGGCADVTVFARNADDTLWLVAYATNGLVKEVERTHQAAQRVVHYEKGTPHNDLVVAVDRGQRVSSATCNDVLVDGGPQVAQTWVPTAGYATLTLQPPVGDDTLPRATLVLTEIDLEDTHGSDPVHVTDFRIEDLLVGWYAG